MERSTKKDSQTSIAVLPFVNMSANPENEYFSDGITEEIINALTSIRGLKVIARTSSFAFKGKNQDIREIGNKLGVKLILEGSVRKANSKVRITAQLINVADGTHFWSENFTRELTDIFALQDEVSLLIADKIREHSGHLDIAEHLVSPQTTSIESYELNLKGRYYFLKWNMPDIERAISYFGRSIEITPDYEQPYFSIGLCYTLLGSWEYLGRESALEMAEQYFNKGKQLGKHSVISHFALAAYEFWGKWNYKEAYQHLRQAHEINPQDPEPLDFMAEINRSIGDFKTAIALNQKALDFNPLSVNAHFTRSCLHYFSEDFNVAKDFIQKGLQLDQHFELLHNLNCLLLTQLKEWTELEGFIEREEVDPLMGKLAIHLYTQFHQEGESKYETAVLLQEIQQLPAPLLYPWDIYIQVYTGQEEQALQTLEQKVKVQMGQVACFKTDPFMRPLRDTSTFKVLVQSSFKSDSIELVQTNAPSNKRPTMLHPEEIAYFSEVLQVRMETEQVYMDPAVTLRSLANMIDLHPNKLSWLLNDQIGKSFSDYINGFRLKAFQEIALKPEFSHLSLLGLAFESGFNSKSVFNNFFKKQTGLTPKAWIRQAKKS